MANKSGRLLQCAVAEAVFLRLLARRASKEGSHPL